MLLLPCLVETTFEKSIKYLIGTSNNIGKHLREDVCTKSICTNFFQIASLYAQHWIIQKQKTKKNNFNVFKRYEK